MPDGRAIVSGREAKTMGALEGVTVVPNTAILQQLRATGTKKQEE